MANNFYGCIAPTGGTNGALDKIDGSILADGDGAFVIDASGNTINVYTLDSGSGAAESAPEIISPDTNAGTKRWILVKIVALGADFNGYEVVLDADGDTSLTADTDDQIDVKVGGTDQYSFVDGKILPTTDNDIDLGDATHEFKDIYVDGVANLDSITAASGATITEFSTDGTMAGDSDAAVPTEQAVVEYAESLVGTSGAGVVAYKNKLINGNFDIWQRGTGTTSAGTMVADRWMNTWSGSGADSAIISQQAFAPGQTDVPGGPSYYERFAATTGAAADEYIMFAQSVEGLEQFSGKTVTLSFYAKASAGTPNISTEFEENFGSGGAPSAGVTAVGVQKHTLSANWQKFTTTATITSTAGKTYGTSGGSKLKVNFWLSAGATYDARTDTLGTQTVTVDFAQIQLEFGSEATAFDVRHRQQELSLCERYYQLITIACGHYANAGAMSIVAQGQYRVTPAIAAPTLAQVTNAILYADANVTTTTCTYIRNQTGFIGYRVSTGAGYAQFSELVSVTAEI